MRNNEQVQPICYDLCSGLGGWSEGFLAEGWRVIGYDIERHEYGDQRYPGELRLKSVLDLHGSELADADAIVASPPCQRYSYMAMPWTRAKDLAAWYREDYLQGETLGRITDLNAIFDACFRIQREASEAAGRHIPMVVENVKGAQPWVGTAAWHYGSFYLWGDVPALMPITGQMRKSQHEPLTDTPAGTGKTSWFFGNSKREGRHYGMDGVKNPGMNWSDYGKPGYVARGFNVTAARRMGGTKCGGSAGDDWFAHHTTGTRFWSGLASSRVATGSTSEQPSISRMCSSKSSARKAASAMIAKIPFPLASHIARTWKP